MRRIATLTRSIVVVMALPFAVVGFSGLLAGAFAQSVQESVTGHIEFINAVGNHIRYSISAIRHHDGTVSGEVEEHAETAEGEFIRRGHGTVLCFTVVANMAFIGGTIDHITSNVPPAGPEFILTVVDNGEGANEPADMATTPVAGAQGLAERHCENPIPRNLFPAERGNIQIRPSGF